MRKFLLFALLLIGESMSAQRNIFDGFDDNSNNWPITGGGSGSTSVHDGYYEVNSINEGYWQYTQTVPGGMANHFRVELSVWRDSATADGKGAGITWGNKGDSARMIFVLYGDGSFVFQKIRDGKSQTVTNRAISFNIFEDDFNNLRVERNMWTGNYDFSINEQLVLSTPFEAPASSEVGIYADVAGSFRFDNFWFVENGNTDESYCPVPLTLSDACTSENLSCHHGNGFSYCVPLGWRVDNYQGTHELIWPVGSPYQIILDVANLTLEDSFGVAAKNDFRVFVDSAKYATGKMSTPMKRDSAATGVECWRGMFEYTDLRDNKKYTVVRLYVYNEELSSFILIECKTLSDDLETNKQFWSTVFVVSRSLHWD